MRASRAKEELAPNRGEPLLGGVGTGLPHCCGGVWLFASVHLGARQKYPNPHTGSNVKRQSAWGTQKSQSRHQHNQQSTTTTTPIQRMLLGCKICTQPRRTATSGSMANFGGKLTFPVTLTTKVFGAPLDALAVRAGSSDRGDDRIWWGDTCLEEKRTHERASAWWSPGAWCVCQVSRFMTLLAAVVIHLLVL